MTSRKRWDQSGTLDLDEIAGMGVNGQLKYVVWRDHAENVCFWRYTTFVLNKEVHGNGGKSRSLPLGMSDEYKVALGRCEFLFNQLL